VAVEPLVDAIAALPGLLPRRAGVYGVEAHRFEVVFSLVLDDDDGPTPAAWASLALVAELVQDAQAGGRQVEIALTALQGKIVFEIDGSLASITPDELAEWFRDLSKVT
jgi:hypothetical protein